MARPDFLNQSAGRDFQTDVASHLGGSAPPFVSIMGNRFRLVDGSGDEPVGELDKKTGMMYFDCVITDGLEVESKIYYVKPFDQNATAWAPPDCWSDNGVAPSRNAGTPQHTVCATCPKAEWGSKISAASGKGIPACGKFQKLAILPVDGGPGAYEPDDMLFLLRVPPNSLSNLRDYLAKIKKGNELVQNVITRVSFAKDQLGTLTFEAKEYINAAIYKVREQLYVEKAADTLVGRGDQPRNTNLAIGQGAQLQQGTQLPPGAVGPGIGSQGVAQQLPPPQTSSPVQGAVTSGQQPMGAQSAVPAQTAEQPARRRRRTKAEMAAEAQATQPQAATQTAPFRPDPPPNLVQPPNANFGIQEPSAASPEMTQTLDTIFGGQ